MNRDVGLIVRTILALALFAFVTMETLGSLHASGAWSAGPHAPAPASPPDPVAPVEALIAMPAPPMAVSVRDPFQIGARPAPVAVAGKPAHKPAPPTPALPVLTAIVWDADPRALVRWRGRDWTVRPGGLFDVFQVSSITRDEVTLSRGSETMVLRRKAQGD